MTTTPPRADLATALQDSFSLLIRRLRQARVDGDLSMAEAQALARLSRRAPTTAAELARAENMRPQSMGATLRSLEALGLLERRPDEGDGRRVLLTLTEAGRRAGEVKHAARAAQLANALEGFTAAERRTLAAAAPLLARLAESLR